MFGEIIFGISILALVYFIYLNKKNSEKITNIEKQNKVFVESIEKYVEIFNENNIKHLMENKDNTSEIEANEDINIIREEYRNKLKKEAGKLSEEHEMLIDFITLALSLLIKVSPSLRRKLIEENTDNDAIKTILISKLPSIEKHYNPVSILEIALSENK